MLEKLDYYDLLGIVVPGTLLVCWLPVCFPVITSVAGSAGFPEAFEVIALVVLAFFVGQLVQAIASLVEPVLYWTWGGRLSDQALGGGLGRYLPKATAARIKSRLVIAAGADTDDHSLFLFAMQRSDSAGIGRAARFNCLYAYHRALLVLILLATGSFVFSLWWGAAGTWSGSTITTTFVILVFLMAIVWYRAKQRGMYYVREVLLTAERVLEDRPIVS